MNDEWYRLMRASVVVYLLCLPKLIGVNIERIISRLISSSVTFSFLRNLPVVLQLKHKIRGKWLFKKIATMSVLPSHKKSPCYIYVFFCQHCIASPWKCSIEAPLVLSSWAGRHLPASVPVEGGCSPCSVCSFSCLFVLFMQSFHSPASRVYLF